MRAAVCREFGRPLVIEDLTLGELSPNDVHVDIAACAVCHSDIHYAEGAWGGTLPAVYGHEAAGTVLAVGTDVTSVSVGDRVVVTLIRSCGECTQCLRGNEVFCTAEYAADDASRLADSDGNDVLAAMLCGAFAEEVVVDHSQVVGIPAAMSWEVASTLACGVLTGVGAVTNTSSVDENSTVVVIGAGGVGLNTVQGAVIAGAKAVIAVDLAEEKLDIARTFGATHVATPDNAASVVAEATGASGAASHVFVTVGARPAILAGLELLDIGGELIIVGMPALNNEIQIDPVNVASYGQRIIGSKMGTARIRRDIPQLIEWYQQGKLKLDELVSATYRLDEINEAIRAVADGAVIRNVVLMESGNEEASR